MENVSEMLVEGPSASSTPCTENSHASTQEESSGTCVNGGLDLTRLTQSSSIGPCMSEDIKDSEVYGCQAMNSKVQSAEDVYNTFLYWRPPLPDISQDLELLQCKTEIHKEGCSASETFCNSCVASSEIKKVLQSLREHMDNPDVQGKTLHSSPFLRVEPCHHIPQDFSA